MCRVSSRRQPERWALWAAVLLCCLYIAWNVPYTHDDWDWGLEIGLERWLSGALNNRYAGTFFVLVMTRSPLLKTLIMGLSLFLIPLLAARLAADGLPGAFFPLSLTAAGILLTMPAMTWQQTLGWVSAFSNFVIPCVFVLALLLLLQKVRSGWSWRPLLPVLFVLTLVSQLFVENLTLVLSGAGTLAVLAAWRTGRGRSASLALSAGAWLGLFLMFCNPLYGDLLSTGQAVDGVRHLSVPVGAGLGALLQSALGRLFVTVLPTLLESHPALWALTGAGAVWRMVKSGRSRWLVVPSGVLFALCAWSFWLSAESARTGIPSRFPSSAFRVVIGPAALLLLAAILWTDRDRSRRFPRLLLLCGILALVVPFALVQDFGLRCCFPSLALLLVLALSLLRDFPWNRWSTAAAGLLVAAALAFHIQVYAVIGGCSALRRQLLDEAAAQNAHSVLLPTEGWRYLYCWGRNPQSPVRADYFRAFYGLPEQLELVFLPRGSYELWPNIPQEMIDHGTVY